jgi:DNA phosphorothioation-dependent restriction protein DptG
MNYELRIKKLTKYSSTNYTDYAKKKKPRKHMFVFIQDYILLLTNINFHESPKTTF